MNSCRIVAHHYHDHTTKECAKDLLPIKLKVEDSITLPVVIYHHNMACIEK